MTIAVETRPPAQHAMAILSFFAAAAFTAAWLGLNFIFPGLQPTGIPVVIVRLVIHGTILAGLWLALARTEFGPSQRAAIWLALAAPFTLWLALVWMLAVDGAFVPRPGGIPRLPLAIFVPVIIGLALLPRSRRVASVLDAAPAFWLVGVQVYRVFGGIFLVGWARGELSSTFALPAGIGDVAIGLLALPVAYYLRAGTRAGRMLGYAWNVLGLIDFAIAIGIGILSAPGPLQLIVPDRPNLQLGTFPTVMIPAFAVPSSILFHILSIWQLRRAGRAAAVAPARITQAE